MMNTMRIACVLASLVSLTAYGQNEWRDKWRAMSYATVNGVEIAYDEVGAGEAILLLHGGQIADSFVPMLTEPSLAEYRLISIHRRGRGQSGDFQGPFNQQLDAADALALLEHLGIPKAHVVAHSASGPVGLLMAMTAPERVQSLILMEPAPLAIAGVDSPLGPNAGQRQQRERAADPQVRAAEWLANMVGDDWETQLSSFYSHAQEHLVRVYESERETTDLTVTESDYASIQAPVLWIWSEQGFFVSEPAFALLEEHGPDMEVRTVPGTSHMLEVLWPGPVAEEIATFVKQHPIE
jgi:3-oxoadipate enol-lactonase